jgi:uncharacterized membrane protein required for colicin V production
MFWAIYLIILFAGFAMLVREGLWSNAIALVNIIVCGLVAFGFYQPITVWLDEMLDGEFTYLLDFVVLWFLFSLAMVVTRAVTAAASKTRMRFKNPIDPVGGPLVGLLAAWVLAAFAMATLHASPMPKDAFGARLVTSADIETASPFTSPDAAWIRFVERATATEAYGDGSFSAVGFVKISETKRANFDKSPSLKVRRG